jgi:asparagine synthase (glutamine-hydrolysing)
MCGIAGIVDTPGSVVQTGTLQRMAHALAHRGPDAQGLWSRGSVGLAHRRLKIIDTSDAANQPMHDASGRYTIVFNGEIYNYRELRKELLSGPHAYPFRTASDTEVLLAAYRAWGTNMLDRLVGMFAFALWDAQEQSLFLARDRLGEKPLYHYYEKGTFCFASEIRSLIASGLVPRRIDPDALVDYLRYRTVHAPYTLVRNVRMLLPGHAMLLRHGKLETWCYWRLGDGTRVNAPLDLRQVHAQIRERLQRAVERQLVSDVPFGAFLSGGIDSSTVVALMAERSTTPVHTFSVGFHENEHTEDHYAALVAERFATKHTTIRLSAARMLELLPNALAAMDHPSADGPNTYVVSMATKQAGVSMALSGLGGDELFGGYPVFRRSALLWRWRTLAALPVAWRRAIAHGIAAVRPTYATAKLPALLGAPSYHVAHTYPSARAAFSQEQLHGLLRTPQLPEDRLHALLQPLLSKSAPMQCVSIAELSTYLPNVLLRDTDQMSMAHALEVRVPFLDHELVEFALAVADVPSGSRAPKPLLVGAMGDLLPSAIVHRRKMGFTLPWEYWLRNELRGFCGAHINSLSTREGFQGRTVQDLWNAFLKHAPSTTWSQIWGLVALEHWLAANSME